MAINTLNKIVGALSQIAERHDNIKSFGFGDIWEAGKSQKMVYSCFWTNCISVTPNKGETGFYSSTTFRFRLFVMDLVNKSDNNDTDVLSDSIQIMQDIISELNDNPFYANENLLISTPNISMTTFREKLNDDVSGVWCDIDFTTPYSYCYNSLPLTPRTV